MTPRAKGTLFAECNRTACRNTHARWWNPNTCAYYCEPCARRINGYIERDPVNECRPVGGDFVRLMVLLGEGAHG